MYVYNICVYTMYMYIYIYMSVLCNRIVKYQSNKKYDKNVIGLYSRCPMEITSYGNIL